MVHKQQSYARFAAAFTVHGWRPKIRQSAMRCRSDRQIPTGESADLPCSYLRQVMAAMPAGRLAGALAGGAAGLPAGLESRDAELLQRLEALRWGSDLCMAFRV